MNEAIREGANAPPSDEAIRVGASAPSPTPRPALQRVMGGIEYFTLGFGTIIGVGWLIVINDWFKRGGPGGAMLAFLIGGLVLVPVAVVYGRLARRMPEAASEIAYTAAVFSPQVSFATGWVLTFAYLIVCPFEAVAIGELAAYLFQEHMDRWPLYQVGTETVYLPYLVLSILTTIGITCLNLRGIRFSATFQNLATFGLLAVFALFVVLGLWRGNPQNLQPWFAEIGPVPSILAVLPIVPYFLMGFETVPKCSEESAADFDHAHFGRVMLWALAVGTFFYVAVVGVVGLMYPWQQLQEMRFATVFVFNEAFGWEWLVQLMIVGAMLSLLKVFNGSFLTATRLLYAMGKRDLLGGKLGVVDEERQTPTAAILVIGGITLAASFLGRSVLEPIADMGSLAIALGWMATCLAYTCGAGGELTGQERAWGVIGAVVSLALAGVAATSLSLVQWVVLAGWGAIGLALAVRGRRG